MTPIGLQLGVTSGSALVAEEDSLIDVLLQPYLDLGALAYNNFPITGACQEIGGIFPVLGIIGAAGIGPAAQGQGCLAIDANSQDAGLVGGFSLGAGVQFGLPGSSEVGLFFSNADTIADLGGTSVCAEFTATFGAGPGLALCFGVQGPSLSGVVLDFVTSDPEAAFDAGLYSVDISSLFVEVFVAVQPEFLLIPSLEGSFGIYIGETFVLPTARDLASRAEGLVRDVAGFAADQFEGIPLARFPRSISLR